MTSAALAHCRPRLVALIGLLSLLTALDARAQSESNAPAAAEPPQPDGSAAAVFAGGCFWCMEPPYDKLPGVISTTAGYVGGHVANPTYEQVSSGGTGHVEAVQVRYDPSKISYEKLLDVFWRNVDPVAVDRQFCDVGAQYRSAIFYGDAGQKRLAEIVAASTFYPAEEYHQDYYEKNPLRYKFYRWNCGRDQRLEELWGEPSS